MATTLKLTKELFKDTIEDVTSSSDKWQSFLSCAAMNYKYDFTDQLLIYAQKPTATACAEIDIWNEKLKRYVNKGVNGIALITEVNGYPRLRYVWDITDTHSVYGRNGKRLRVWNIPKMYESQVIEALCNKYSLDYTGNLSDTLKQVAIALSNDNYQDYLNDLYYNTKNTRLEFISRDVVEKEYKTLLNNSIDYMLLKRCGIDPSPFFISTDFKNINMFQDMDSIINLGGAATDISKMGLQEV